MAYKKYNQKTFSISNEPNIEVNCYSQQTSYGFRHVAILIIDYEEIKQVSSAYYNRTWESYEYESVLIKLADKLNKKDILKDQLIKFIEDYQKIDQEEVSQKFKSIAMIANMADIMGMNKKDSNDWKERMLKAGLENKGLIMPDDWNGLTEDEKEIRLNNVINQLK